MNTYEEDRLIRELRRCVTITINRYPKFIKGQHSDEMESTGMKALLSAIRRYDPSRGMTLRNFCINTIRGAIGTYLRLHRLHIRRLEAFKTGNSHAKILVRVRGNSDEDETHGDSIPVRPYMHRISYEAVNDTEIEFQLLNLRLNKYPKQRDAHVFRAYFGLDGRVPLDQNEIGKRLGISHQAVSLIIKTVAKNLSLG